MRVLLPLGEGGPGEAASAKGRSLNKGPEEGFDCGFAALALFGRAGGTLPEKAALRLRTVGKYRRLAGHCR